MKVGDKIQIPYAATECNITGYAIIEITKITAKRVYFDGSDTQCISITAVDKLIQSKNWIIL